MNIDKYTDAINNCRFCFMCRHLSAVGNVNFTEADTPRVRAAAIYGAVKHPEWWGNADFIDMLYRSDLAKNCAHHCVNHFDENGLVIAARADVVEKGFAPAKIQAIRQELLAEKAWKVTGKGDVLYVVDPYTAEAGIDKTFAELMKKAKVSYAAARGGCLGRALKVLGFAADAEEMLKRFAETVNASKSKIIVVSNPAAYEAVKNDAAGFGIKIKVKVMHTSEYLLTLPLKYAKKAGKLFYIESDYLKNYNDLAFPHELLKAVGAEEQHFGASRDWLGVPDQQESFSCGEGAVVLPRIDAELAAKLAKYVEKQSDDPANDRIVVASPYTKLVLSRCTALKVETLEEVALKAL